MVIYRSYVHTQILLNKSVQIVEQRGLSGEPIDVRDSRSRGPADGSNSSGGWRRRLPHARPSTGRACSDLIGTSACLEPRRLRRGQLLLMSMTNAVHDNEAIYDGGNGNAKTPPVARLLQATGWTYRVIDEDTSEPMSRSSIPRTSIGFAHARKMTSP